MQNKLINLDSFEEYEPGSSASVTQNLFPVINLDPISLINNHEAHSLLLTTAVTESAVSSGRLCGMHIVKNRIKIDKGLFLAPDPKTINNHWSVGHKGGAELVKTHVEKLKSFLDLQRFSQRYAKTLNVLFANLLNAKNTNSQLLYSRNTAGSLNHTLMRVIDYLESENLVVNIIGKSNEFEGNQSWLIPTYKLVLELESSRVRIELLKNAPMIILRDKEGNDKKINIGKKEVSIVVKQLSAPVKNYNKMWLNHSITFFDHHLVPYCRRIFNRRLDLGGRFYGTSVQTMPKADRNLILIDGEKTTEPDFKCIHYCLLYAEENIELNPSLKDPYIISGFSRDTAKLASLILMNSENIGSFKANVTKSGNPEIKYAMNQYETDYELFIKRSAKKLPTKEPHKPIFSKGFIKGMPDHINGADLYASITDRHAAIAHHFGTLNIGLKLQYLDSQVMAGALTLLSKKNIPVIPVHDSLRCKISDLDDVEQAMKAAYAYITGFNAVITK